MTAKALQGVIALVQIMKNHLYGLKQSHLIKMFMIQATLENDKGEKITEPENFAEFRFNEKEFARFCRQFLGDWIF